MRKYLNIFILIGAFVLGYGLFNKFLIQDEVKPAALNASTTAPPVNTLGVNRTPKLALEPATFSIPKLGVKDVKVESVGLDKENKMDIPKDENNVAWYNLGAKPGENGNAVIAGHFDKKTGAPAVFYNIGKLVPGDELITTDREGKAQKFIVTEVATYPLADFPLEEVFGLYDKPRLNLITCEGDYDKSSKLYSHRLVVYSELQN